MNINLLININLSQRKLQHLFLTILTKFAAGGAKRQNTCDIQLTRSLHRTFVLVSVAATVILRKAIKLLEDCVSAWTT